MFLLLGCALQLWVVLEFLIRRFLKLVIGSYDEPLCRYADRNFMSLFGGMFVDVLSAPVQVLVACVSTPLTLVLIVMVVFGAVLAASDTNGVLLTSFVTAYNSVAPVLNRMLDMFGVGVQVLRGVIIPVWNASCVLVDGLIFQVLGPLLWTHAQSVADMLENAVLSFAALGNSFVSYFSAIAYCTRGQQACEGAGCVRALEAVDLRCLADPAYLSLDLMTPGIFMRRAMFSAVEALSSACQTTAVLVNIVSYPLVDYNTYKALHCFVNSPLAVVRVATNAVRRCEYVQTLPLSAAERAVACTPDTYVWWAPLIEGLRALGLLLDNWVNVGIDIVMSELGDSGASCKLQETDLPDLVTSSAAVMTKSVRAVGLTSRLLALTDGRDIVYRPEGESYVWSLHAWPFDVDIKHGIAPTSSPLSMDFDAAGVASTAMFGCRCEDAPFRILCATVPMSRNARDETDDYRLATQHLIHFTEDVSALQCSRVLVKVTPLRFSRRRAAAAYGSGDADARDIFGDEGGLRAEHLSADAALYVQPWCGGGEGSCVEDVSACFPFCMGLHVGSYGAQNITMYNARTWDEYVSVRQVDCAVEPDAGGVCSAPASTGGFTELLSAGVRAVARCETPPTSCLPAEAAASFLALDAYGTDSPVVQQKKKTFPRVRLQQQPFVIAGDVMLTEDPDGSRVTVTRLYNNGRGAFALRNEHLTLVSNANAIELVDCDGNARSACVSEAALAGKLPRPRSYFFVPEQLPAASSEWAVHWAANPPNEVYQAYFEFCSKGIATTTLLVHSSYSRARVWTLRTMREADMAGAASGTSPVAYMLVPNWFEAREERPACDEVVALKVTAVEFLDANNILVTVLEARPQDWDVLMNDVCSTCPRRFKYYFINPNRHDCLEPREGSGSHFSCWKETPWQSELSALAPGRLCPALNRAPPIGSLATEGLVLAVRFTQMLAEAVISVPAAAAGGSLKVLQQSRSTHTMHSLLDSGGAQFLAVEPVIESYSKVGHKITMTLVKTFELFRGLPGHTLLEPMVVGAATVVGSQATNPASLLLPMQLKAIRDIPVRQVTSSTVQSFVTLSGPLPLGTARTALLALGFADYFVSIMRITRRVLLRIFQGASTPGRFVLELLQTSIFESQQDIRDGVLESARNQCNGLASVIRGGTLSTDPGQNAFSGFFLHACQIGPDLVEGVFTVSRVLFSEYPAVSCVCNRPVGLRTVSGLDDISETCLARVVPISLREWTLGLVFAEDNSQNDLCFAAMDGANARLEGAFDRALSRMYLASTYAAEGFDYLLSAVTADKEKCNSYQTSAYVAAIVPEPVDYFLGCLHIPDCRIKCYDEYVAFEESIAQLESANVGLPSFDSEIDVDVESPIFDPALTETGEDQPPFEIQGVTELPDEACTAICDSSPVPRCVAVSGSTDSGGELAYYCLPLDVTRYIYRHFIAAEFTLPPGRLLDLFIATTFYVHASPARPDWLVAHTYVQGETEIHLCIAGLAPRRLLVTAPSIQGQSPSGVGYLQTVTRVNVRPALHHGDTTQVTVVGKRRVLVEDAFEVSTVALCLDLSTESDNSAVFIRWGTCESMPTHPKATRVCVGESCHDSLHLLDEELAWGEDTYPIPEALQMTDVGLYATAGGAFPTRTLVSPVVLYSEDPIEIVTVNTAAAYKSWLHIVTVSRTVEGLSAVGRASQALRQSVPISVQCRVDRCVGCQTADQDPAYVELQARCYAAQQCGIARCAGSLVNMRKPLCSLGKLFAQELVVAQSALGVLWHSVAQKVVLVVELTEARRREYELKFADEAIATAICTSKDAMVQVRFVFYFNIYYFSLNRILLNKSSIDCCSSSCCSSSGSHLPFFFTIYFTFLSTFSGTFHPFLSYVLFFNSSNSSSNSLA